MQNTLKSAAWLLVLIATVVFAADPKRSPKMSDGLSAVQSVNPNVSKKDLQFIEASLAKAKVIKSFDDVLANHLRVFVESTEGASFSVHVGSADPYQGGSGATYSVKKADGQVTLQSTETYAPAPKR